MGPEDGVGSQSNTPNGRQVVVPSLKLKMKNVSSLEDEEYFEGPSSLRTQYRFETTEDELLNQSDMEANGAYNMYRVAADNLGLVTPPKRLSNMDIGGIDNDFDKLNSIANNGHQDV